MARASMPVGRVPKAWPRSPETREARKASSDDTGRVAHQQRRLQRQGHGLDQAARARVEIARVGQAAAQIVDEGGRPVGDPAAALAVQRLDQGPIARHEVVVLERPGLVLGPGADGGRGGLLACRIR